LTVGFRNLKPHSAKSTAPSARRAWSSFRCGMLS